MRPLFRDSILPHAIVACVALGTGWTPDPTLTLLPESRLWVDGSSTVRSWSCAATEIDATIEASTPDAVKAVIDGEKAVRAVDVKIPVAKLDCRNGTMNEHMRKALKAKEHPVIAFTVTSYDVARGATGVTGTLDGQLTLGGITKPVAIRAAGVASPDGTLHVTGTHEIAMTEFGLKPPTLMLGTMRVGDKVKVSFDLYLRN
jgi:polyisoprenoid-binding protein YceI